MADYEQANLRKALSTLEPPLPDDGFSARVLAHLPAQTAALPRPRSALSRPQWWALLVALAAGTLVMLTGLAGLDFSHLQDAVSAELLSLAGVTITGAGLYLFAGWLLTVIGCGWTLSSLR